jgi:hypothetical protein
MSGATPFTMPPVLRVILSMKSRLAACCEHAVLVHRLSCRLSTGLQDSSGTVLLHFAMLLLLQAMQLYRMKVYGVGAIFAGERRISG